MGATGRATRKLIRQFIQKIGLKYILVCIPRTGSKHTIKHILRFGLRTTSRATLKYILKFTPKTMLPPMLKPMLMSTLKIILPITLVFSRRQQHTLVVTQVQLITQVRLTTLKLMRARISVVLFQRILVKLSS